MLRRMTTDLYYMTTWAGDQVDFYLPAQRQLTQVTQNHDQPATHDKKVRALSDALRESKLSRGLILAERNAPPIKGNGQTIEIRSVVEWLALPSSRKFS